MTRYRYNAKTREWEEMVPRGASKRLTVHVAKDINFVGQQVVGEEAEGAAHYNEEGCPVFTSRQEVRRFLDRQKERGNENAEYGDGWTRIR
ncbi:MAG: hypothetical protein JSV86_12805 [Gemmatimonadota bacterium]|nr:MAG: hypothetical protein JSV86_12805 [Gemmatimonadota bacterium]